MLGRLWASIWDAIGNAVDWLLDAIGDAVAWVFGPIVDLLDGPIEWIDVAVVNVIAWLRDLLDPIVDPVGNLLDPVGEILADLWPPVVAGIATIVVLRAIRWLLLLWRGRTPRVQISNFAWAASDKADGEATWVTSLFREQLAALRLDALDPLPERAPGAPLVEIVEGVGQGVGRNLDIGKALGRLFRTVWPDAAYEVWGTLRPKEGGGGRISVQLIERRRGNRTLLNIALDQASWEEGAREAAMAVAGALYPRVRKTDRGPWTMWNGTVPRALMSNYHAARQHEEADRLEPALAAYHAALDLDPLNPNLRLKIAMLQERLELNLDAWVTYEAIVDESDRRAWRGPDRRVYMLALYRLAVMLSNGRVAEQWVKNPAVADEKRTLRDDERNKRREELMMSLKCDPLFTTPKVRLGDGERAGRPTRIKSNQIVGSPAKVLLTMLRSIQGGARDASEMLLIFNQTDDTEDLRKHRIDAVLQILSLRRLEELDAWLRLRPPVRPRKWRAWWAHHRAVRHWLKQSEFARSAIRVSELLVRIRIAASLEGEIGRVGTGSMSARDKHRWVVEIRQAHRAVTKRWPFPASNPWRATTHKIAPRRWWANQRDDAWQLHYNAACATASVLRKDSVLSREPKALPGATDKDAVVARAIEQLEEYAFRAGSHRVAAQADWLAIDDPDLRWLREEPEFKLWASHHLPRTLPPDLPTRKTDVKRFTVRVVHQGARLFADVWRERADRHNPTAAEIVEWWEEDRKAWELLGNACREHLSWQERLSWLEMLQDWQHTAQRKERLNFGHEARGTAAAEMVTKELFPVIADLTGAPQANGGPKLQPPPGTVLAWIKTRAELVRSAYEQGERRADGSGLLRLDREREEALKAFRVWARLADAFGAELAAPYGNGKIEELDLRVNRIIDALTQDDGESHPA